MTEERAIKFFSEVMGKTMGLLLKHEETRIANWYESDSDDSSTSFFRYARTLMECADPP